MVTSFRRVAALRNWPRYHSGCNGQRHVSYRVQNIAFARGYREWLSELSSGLEMMRPASQVLIAHEGIDQDHHSDEYLPYQVHALQPWRLIGPSVFKRECYLQ